MFNLRDFIFKGIIGMVGNIPEFKIIQYASDWYARGTLTEYDLAAINELLTPEEPEEIIEDTEEE